MEPTRFCYLPTLNVKITRAELTLLRLVCERHYDSKVRGLSVPGVGAILNGAHNTFESRADSGQPLEALEVEFTYHQLDLLAKGLEGAQTFEEKGFFLQAKKMMALLGKEADRVNRLPQPAADWWKGQMVGT